MMEDIGRKLPKGLIESTATLVACSIDPDDWESNVYTYTYRFGAPGRGWGIFGLYKVSEQYAAEAAVIPVYPVFPSNDYLGRYVWTTRYRPMVPLWKAAHWTWGRLQAAYYWPLRRLFFAGIIEVPEMDDVSGFRALRYLRSSSLRPSTRRARRIREKLASPDDVC